MRKTYFVTGNKNKFIEARDVLSDVIELEQLDIDLIEIQSMDPKEIIEHKIKEAAKTGKKNLIVEDQYMNISCLKGFPGPLIKWFANILGNQGVADLVHNYPDHTAMASVVIGYSEPKKDIQYFHGSVAGRIVQPRGEKGWGWDNIFELEGIGKTFAEMEPGVKNQSSMRKKAFEKLKEYLLNIE